MGEGIPQLINLALLKTQQSLLQTHAGELIELYLKTATRKVATLHKSLDEMNFINLKSTAEELRHRSVEIGAVTFSYYCLVLEMAVQEMRNECLVRLVDLLHTQFEAVVIELEQLKQKFFS